MTRLAPAVTVPVGRLKLTDQVVLGDVLRARKSFTNPDILTKGDVVIVQALTDDGCIYFQNLFRCSPQAGLRLDWFDFVHRPPTRLKADYSHMSAAPAAPQAAGVGEERVVVETAVSTLRWAMNRGDDISGYKEPLELVMTAALRAPSREPEGGAVFEGLEAMAEAWSDRTEVQEMVSANTAVFAKWADANLLSRFRQNVMGIVQQAFIEGAALATREEAPAVPDDVQRLVNAARVVAFEDQGPDAIKALDVASEAFADRVPWENEPHSEEAPAEAGEIECDGCDGDRCVYVGSLCNPSAKPQAREDAQPVAGMTVTLVETAPHLPANGSLAIRVWDNHGLSAGTHQLYTHPDPDALRVTGPMAQAAIKHLRSIATVDVGYLDEPMMRSVILAALQAEQKGGAA